ncbi:hypothetical protein [Poriferisphaera sp. WC338]|uniref:hypothetical protein n=1 Tax=Poriferisphaera sp. WC338 TaxID=3425129 RepID=UPI003D8192DE
MVKSKACFICIMLLLLLSLLLGYRVYLLEKEMWLWSTNGLGWPRKAGSGDASRDYLKGKLQYLILANNKTDLLTKDQLEIEGDGVRTFLIENNVQSGKLFAISEKAYFDAYNKKMQQLIMESANNNEE